MAHDFDRVIDRRCTASNKWRKYPADVLPLWVADMDFASPEPVVRALRERVEHGVYGYGFEEPEFARGVRRPAAEALRLARVARGDRLHLPGSSPASTWPAARSPRRATGSCCRRRSIRRSSASPGNSRAHARRGAAGPRPRTAATRWTSTRSAAPSTRAPASSCSATRTTRSGRVFTRAELVAASPRSASSAT